MVKMCVGGVFSICLVSAVGVSAELDEALAKEKYMSGVEKAEAEDYEGASIDFEASNEAYPNYNCLFNLGLCYFKLERFYDSLVTFEKLKLTFPEQLSDADNAVIEVKIDNVRKVLPSLELVVDRDGAEVFVDGEKKGKTPLSSPIVMTVGSHEIEVREEGCETMAWKLTMNKWEHRKETLMLTRRPPPSDMAVAPVVEEHKDDPIPKSGGTPTDEAFRLEYSPVLLIAGTAAAGVMAGVSIGFWVAAFKQRDIYTRNNDRLKELDEWDGSIQKKRDDSLRLLKAYNNVAVVTTAVTGIFIAVTAVELVLKLTGKKKSFERVSAAPFVTVAF